jgi:hypothetical protein
MKTKHRFVGFAILCVAVVVLAGCGIFESAQTFQDKDSGFSIKLPENWEEVDSVSVIGDYRSASEAAGLPMEIVIYMDTDTMADIFMFVKVGIPAEYGNLSADEILKEAMPDLYLDHLVKEKLNGNTVFTFIDTLGMGQAQGGFVWVKENMLHYVRIRVFNASRLEGIYKSARLQ